MTAAFYPAPQPASFNPTTVTSSTNDSSNKNKNKVDIRNLPSFVTTKIRNGQTDDLSSDDVKRLCEAAFHNDDGTDPKRSSSRAESKEKEGEIRLPYLDRPYLHRGAPTTTDDTNATTATTLVRYVGFVQDVLEPEYYQSSIGGVGTKYRDCRYEAASGGNDADGGVSDADAYQNLAERHPLVVVPVPFASDWWSTKTTSSAQAETSEQERRGTDRSSSKRSRDVSLSPSDAASPSSMLAAEETDEAQESVAASPARRKPRCDKDNDDEHMEGGGDALSPLVAGGAAHGRTGGDTTDDRAGSGMTSGGGDVAAAYGGAQRDGGNSNTLDWWPKGCMNSSPEQCPILAKMYYDEDASDKCGEQDRLRLNDVAEFIGVLSMDPMDADFAGQTPARRNVGGDAAIATEDGTGGLSSVFLGMGFDNDEFMDRLVLPPPSLLPRLHVLGYRRLDLDYVESFPLSSFNANANSDGKAATAMSYDDNGDGGDDDDRALTINTFADVLFHGDQVASEALLLTLLSMAERQPSTSTSASATTRSHPTKTPSDATLGCASLNLVLPAAQTGGGEQMKHNGGGRRRFVRRLCSVLRQVVPVLSDVSLTLDGLNSNNSSSSVDGGGNGTVVVAAPSQTPQGRLTPSVLQLPKGSTLVVDQSELSVGPIDPDGQRALLALSKATEKHTLPYRFDGMMEYNFEADYRTIVVSCKGDGRRGGGMADRNCTASTGQRRGSLTSAKKETNKCTLRLEVEHVDDGGDAASDDAMDGGDDDDEAILPTPLAIKIRSYLLRCRAPRLVASGVPTTTTNVALSRSVLQQAEKDFVQRRVDARTNNKGMQERGGGEGQRAIGSADVDQQVGEDDFHRWLTLTRLQARSRSGIASPAEVTGSPEATAVGATVEDWEAALRLDDSMRARRG